MPDPRRLRARRRAVRLAAPPLLVALPLAVALALLWAAAAPTPAVVPVRDVLVSEEMPEFEAAQDVAFAVLAVLAGLLHGAVLLLARWVQDVPAAAGALVGACLGAVLAWWLGMAAGPPPIGGQGEADALRAPLDLEAYGVLGLWPATLAAVLFAGLLVVGLSTGDGR